MSEVDIWAAIKNIRRVLNDYMLREFVGNDYGSIYGNDMAWTQAAAAQNTWYAVTDSDFTSGPLRTLTHDGSGTITVPNAGIYAVNLNLTIECSIANKHVEYGIALTPSGGALTAQAPLMHKHFDAANTEHPAGWSNHLAITAAATINAIVRTTDAGTPNITVDHCTLEVTRVA